MILRLVPLLYILAMDYTKLLLVNLYSVTSAATHLSFE